MGQVTKGSIDEKKCVLLSNQLLGLANHILLTFSLIIILPY